MKENFNMEGSANDQANSDTWYVLIECVVMEFRDHLVEKCIAVNGKTIFGTERESITFLGEVCMKENGKLGSDMASER